MPRTASGLVSASTWPPANRQLGGGLDQAGGPRTVRYGNMGSKVTGGIGLPDGSVVRRHSRVRRQTGYDLPSLFVGAEGTLGETRAHPTPDPDPAHRVTDVCGFDELGPLVDAGRFLRDLDGIAALEFIIGEPPHWPTNTSAAAAASSRWLLLVELASDFDQTERLADALDSVHVCRARRRCRSRRTTRLWRMRESLAEVVGVFGRR